jgi:hypothetical protein
MNGYATARQNGLMSANDIRELENLDRTLPRKGGDLYLINGNMLPLGAAGAFANTSNDDGKEDNTDEEQEVLGVEERGGRKARTQNESLSLTAPLPRRAGLTMISHRQCSRMSFLQAPGRSLSGLLSGWRLHCGQPDYSMLMDYRGDVTVKIDGIAASAASVIAMGRYQGAHGTHSADDDP